MSDGMTEIETILDALLTAIERHEASHPREAGAIEETLTKLAEMEAHSDREDIDLSALLRDPIGAALRQTIRRLGSYVYHEAGGLDAMGQALDRIARLGPEDPQRRAIVNLAWNGIGEGNDRWWA